MTSKNDELLRELQSKLKETHKEIKREIKIDINIDAEPAETCVERMREIYALLRAVHEESLQALKVVQSKWKNDGSTQNDLADLMFVMRETKAIADDIRKEYNKEYEQIAWHMCERWTRDANAPTSYQGWYCRANCSIKPRYNCPSFKRDPEEYNAVCDWLGIPDDLRDKGLQLFQEGEFKTKVFDFDWIGWNHLIQKYIEAGIPLPEFIQKMATPEPEHQTIVTKMHDIL